MAKIFCLDDYPLYAEMVAQMLKSKGKHTVKVDTVPLLLDDIKAFDPDVIVLNLVRKVETLSAGGMKDFYAEVDGARAFREIALLAKTERYPVIVTGLAVLERELPKDLAYVAFIEIPQRLDVLLKTIDKVVAAAQHHSPLAPE